MGGFEPYRNYVQQTEYRLICEDNLVVILNSWFCDFCDLFYHFIFHFRCFSIYSIEMDITKLIYASRSIDTCNRNLERTSKTFFLNNFSIFRKRIFGFIQVFDIFESNRSNVTLSSFSSHQIP